MNLKSFFPTLTSFSLLLFRVPSFDILSSSGYCTSNGLTEEGNDHSVVEDGGLVGTIALVEGDRGDVALRVHFRARPCLDVCSSLSLVNSPSVLIFFFPPLLLPSPAVDVLPSSFFLTLPLYLSPSLHLSLSPSPSLSPSLFLSLSLSLPLPLLLLLLLPSLC